MKNASQFFVFVAAIKDIPSRNWSAFSKIPATDLSIVSTTRKLIRASVTMTLDVRDTSQERKVANISVGFRKIRRCEIAIDDGEERIYLKNPESELL